VCAHFQSSCFGIHLSQDRAFAEKQWFPGIYHHYVKIRLPVSVWLAGLHPVKKYCCCIMIFLLLRRRTIMVTTNKMTYRSTMRVIKQIRHNHVSEPVITVGQQKHLGTTLSDPSQEHGQPGIFVDVIG